MPSDIIVLLFTVILSRFVLKLHNRRAPGHQDGPGDLPPTDGVVLHPQPAGVVDDHRGDELAGDDEGDDRAGTLLPRVYDLHSDGEADQQPADRRP